MSRKFHGPTIQHCFGQMRQCTGKDEETDCKTHCNIKGNTCTLESLTST